MVCLQSKLLKNRLKQKGLMEPRSSRTVQATQQDLSLINKCECLICKSKKDQPHKYCLFLVPLEPLTRKASPDAAYLTFHYNHKPKQASLHITCSSLLYNQQRKQTKIDVYKIQKEQCRQNGKLVFSALNTTEVVLQQQFFEISINNSVVCQCDCRTWNSKFTLCAL